MSSDDNKKSSFKQFLRSNCLFHLWSNSRNARTLCRFYNILLPANQDSFPAVRDIWWPHGCYHPPVRVFDKIGKSLVSWSKPYHWLSTINKELVKISEPMLYITNTRKPIKTLQFPNKFIFALQILPLSTNLLSSLNNFLLSKHRPSYRWRKRRQL